MSTEIMSALPDPMTQSRLTELELENKRLREQLKAYETKYGPLKCEATSAAGRDGFHSHCGRLSAVQDRPQRQRIARLAMP